ncbi:MAG: carbon-nitrogen hydrolase family protein [Hyphomicrobiaceae bacterium]
MRPATGTATPSNLDGQPGAQPFKAALVQLCSGEDVAENIDVASRLITEAAQAGASYVQTPEVTTLMVMKRDLLFARAEPFEGHRAVEAFSSLARELRIWLHIGSMVVKVSDEKVANRAVIFDPLGRLVTTYDKIHMFDVDLPGGERYRESTNYRPGDTAKLVQTPWGGLGVTICYDMRFAPLYAALAGAGALFVTMPSAFTVPTGLAHWHTLLRARAIETQCFVLAAAQAGQHACGRTTYGHSLIISPWGEILAEGDGESVSVITADIDPALIHDARTRVPSLRHIVPFNVETVRDRSDEAQ